MAERAAESEREAIEVGMRPTSRDAADPEAEGRLLVFYDRLRERVRDYVLKRAPVLDPKVVDALLAAPDFFVLLMRLSLDRNVPVETRRLIAGAVAYFVLPIDLLPEAIVGPAGFVDDVVLAATVVSHVMGQGLEGFVERYWSGDRAIRLVLRDVGSSARALLGPGLFGRLSQLLRRRGLDLS